MQDTNKECEKRYALNDIRGWNNSLLWKVGEEVPYWIYDTVTKQYVENPYYIHYAQPK